jgi:hypothetical protein
MQQGNYFECGKGYGPPGLCSCTMDGDCTTGVGANGTCNNDGICACSAGLCNRGEACKLVNTVSTCSCNNGTACAAGDTCCQTPSGCWNLETDPANCGACGRRCPPSFTCVNGACGCLQDKDCYVGASGTCVAGVCKCGAANCLPGQRCVAFAVCG